MADPDSPARRATRSSRSLGGEPTRRSIWPAIYPQLLELVREHTSTIVFVNSRRAAERLALRLNELAGSAIATGEQQPAPREIARAHHGSLAREERTTIEELLKAGELPCLVATSSLELGIDMGAVDLVIQVESPKSVARGLQRIGRAGHGVGRGQRGPDLPQVPRRPARVRGRRARGCARARSSRPSCRATRSTCSPSRSSRSPPAPTSVAVDDLYALVTRTYSYGELRRELLENVLDMLDGRYPSSEFGELRARIVWDRARAARSARARARAAGRRQRRHDPRPRPVHRHAARTGAASASSTRRWSTRRAPGRRSCSAPRPGGSRRSAATA